MPIIFMDLNDGIGMKKCFSGFELVPDTQCISPSGARLERLPGGAGALMRAVLDKHNMFCASASNDSRDTFWVGGTSIFA